MPDTFLEKLKAAAMAAVKAGADAGDKLVKTPERLIERAQGGGYEANQAMLKRQAVIDPIIAKAQQKANEFAMPKMLAADQAMPEAIRKHISLSPVTADPSKINLGSPIVFGGGEPEPVDGGELDHVSQAQAALDRLENLTKGKKVEE